MSEKAMKLALEAVYEIIIQWDEGGGKRSRRELARRIVALAEQPAQKCSYPYCGCNSKAWCKVERNEALDKKAENARELGLDYEPAKDNSNYRFDPPGLDPSHQEPVAYLCENAVGHKYFRWKKPSSTYKPIALYTSPPAQSAWVGLTRLQINQMMSDAGWQNSAIRQADLDKVEKVARAIEAKLKEKKT